MKSILLIFKAYIAGASLVSRGRREQLKRSWGRQKWMLPLMIVGMALAVVSYISLLVQNYRSMYQLGVMLGHPDFVLYLSQLLSWMILLVFTFTSAISVMYRSSDTPLLLSLPFSPFAISAGKMLVLYTTMLPLHLAVTMPAIALFCWFTGFALHSAVAAIILLFISPLVPITLSALLASLIMRSTARTRHRTFLEVLGMLAILAVIIALQAFMTRMTVETGEDMGVIIAFLSQRIDQFYTDFPPFGWVSRSFLPGNWELTGITLATFLPAALICIYVTSLRYVQLLQRSSEHGGDESHKKRQNGSREAWREVPVSRLLIRREWMIIRSNSTFILQLSMEILIIPLLLGVMSLTGSLGDIRAVTDFVMDSGFAELLIFGILLIFFLLSSISATSVSREGGTIAISRMLPIAPRQIVQAKVLFHVILGFSAYCIYLLAGYLFFSFNLFHLIYMLPGGLAFLTASSVLGLHIDLRRPLLTWTHPQQAMKQNMNVLVSMGMNTLLIAIMGGSGYLLLLVEVPTLIIGVIEAVAAICAAYLLIRSLPAAAGQCYGPQME